MIFTLNGVFISINYAGPTWFLGQLLFAFGAMMWLHLMCHFARGEVFPQPVLNTVGGHISSCLCFIPYHQFQYMNAGAEPNAIPLNKKFFIPVNVVAWSVKNFWNLRKLFKLYPARKPRIQFVVSVLVMKAFILLTPLVPQFWKTFGLSYLIYFIMVELFLSYGKLNISTKVQV